MKRFPFEGAFIDVWMAMETGLDLYDWMLTAYPGVAANVVFLTGDILPTPELRARLERTGRPVLHKPFDLNELDRCVSQWTYLSGRASSVAVSPEPRAPA